ncbi:hypothetical protein [Yoonia sp. 2307UL14-13]|uniref:hypothetical protein n=1 Tax=Yoonia sp. 2307UL14-13 TaxID=3126506 RepID=UPI0030B12C8A
MVDIADGSPQDDSLFEAPIEADSKLDIDGYSIASNRLFPLINTDRVGFSAVEKPEDKSGPGPVSAPESKAMASVLSDLEAAVTESIDMGLFHGSLNQEPRPEEFPPITAVSEPAPGLRLTTGVDERSAAPGPDSATTQSGAGCIPNHLVDVEQWGDDRSFAEQIAEARDEIALERERMNAEAILTLARLYVHFGFGREALQALEMRSMDSRETQYLAAVATIIDDLPGQPGLFSEQASCDAKVALWAMLATEQPDTTVNPNAILRGFAALPEHLKKVLAPRLADRFIAIGDHDAAAQILDRQENKTELTPELRLSRANLQDAVESPENIDFSEFIRGGDRVGPETMIAHFESAVENRINLTPDDFLLGDAIRFELAEEARAVDVAVAQFRAYLSQNDFDGARAIFDEIAELAGRERRDALWETYAQTATDAMDDAPFLHFAFDVDVDSLPIHARADIADRLRALGFDGRARSLAAEKPSISPNAPQPVALDTEITDLQQWRDRDWQGLTQSDDALFGEISHLALGESGPAFDDTKPLATGREAIEASSETRQLINQMLLRFSRPSNPGESGS